MSKFNTSTELDAWASALGARTDSEAVAAVARLQRRIIDGATDLRGCLDLMPQVARRAQVTESARSWLATAALDAEEAAYQLALVKSAFARHERGEI